MGEFADRDAFDVAHSSSAQLVIFLIQSFLDGKNPAAAGHVATQPDELRARVKRFAVRVLMFVKTLPHGPATDEIARQLSGAALGVSGNYHSAGRSRSHAEFTARMGVVADEAGESEHWLEVIADTKIASGPEFDWLLNESHELRAIFVKGSITARANRAKFALQSKRRRPS